MIISITFTVNCGIERRTSALGYLIKLMHTFQIWIQMEKKTLAVSLWYLRAMEKTLENKSNKEWAKEICKRIKLLYMCVAWVSTKWMEFMMESQFTHTFYIFML